MGDRQSLSITLPEELARMGKEKVASGAYASESEVVGDGLRALKARDEAVQTWLREKVAPTYDRVMDGKEKLLPAAGVFKGASSRLKAKAKP
jgi:putative addiction module CopG family antidote